MRSIESRLAELEEKIKDMEDRKAILDCILDNARGCDRHDSDLLSNSYLAEGIDEHGSANILKGSEYPLWANQVHTQGSIQNLHNITNHTCEILGDVAHAESYVIGLFFNADGKTARLLSGRYIDRLEKRDGKWKIALRRCTVEVGLTADAAFMNSDYFRDMGFLKGLRSREDLSYSQNLDLGHTPKGHRW